MNDEKPVMQTLTGLPPSGHKVTDPEPKKARPPFNQRSEGSSWRAVQYWTEIQHEGTGVSVVCFACGSVFMHRFNEGQPVVDGGLIRHNGTMYACRCQTGRRWTAMYPTATQEIVELAVVADATDQRTVSEIGGPKAIRN